MSVRQGVARNGSTGHRALPTATLTGLAKQLPHHTLTVLRDESIRNERAVLVVFILTVQVAIGELTIGPVDLVVRFIGSYLDSIAAGLLVRRLPPLPRHRNRLPARGKTLSVFASLAMLLDNPTDPLQQCGRGHGVSASARSSIRNRS